MNHDDIKKMQEVASRLTKRKTLEVIEKRQEELDAKMRELRQQEIEQEKMLLEELLEEEREEAFMVLEGEFNVPYGHKNNRFSKAYITKIVNQIKYVEEMLQKNNWRFICQPFEETIAAAPKNSSFIYCDPPYIGRHVDYYDSWCEEDEKKLNSILSSSNNKFMLSTWDYNEYRIMNI